MDGERLPPELAELERRLIERRRVLPPAALRHRVIAAVGSEVRRERSVRVWRKIAVAAAVALFWLNVSFSASNAIDVPITPTQPQDSVRQLTLRIEAVLPEISHEEAKRQAILYRSGIELVPFPDVAPRMIDITAPTNTSG